MSMPRWERQNLRGCGGNIIMRERMEKGGYSLGGVASRSAARSGGKEGL